jgi:hypothetical protein
MPITVEQKCNRCRRDVKHVVSDIAQAQKLEVLREKRELHAKRIEEFLKSVPADEMPDLVVIRRAAGAESGYQVLSLPTLCDFKEEGKRSCSVRVSELVTALDQLEERKKPVRKAAAPIPLTNEAKK